MCDWFYMVFFTVAHLVLMERGGLVTEMDTVEDKDQVESLVTRVELLLITSLLSGYLFYYALYWVLALNHVASSKNFQVFVSQLFTVLWFCNTSFLWNYSLVSCVNFYLGYVCISFLLFHLLKKKIACIISTYFDGKHKTVFIHLLYLFGFNRDLELDLGLGLAVEPVGMVLVLLLDLIFLEREM